MELLFKSCAPFTDCISKINNRQRNNLRVIDVVMTMCNLIKYSDNNYSEPSGSLLQYYRD